MLDSATITIQDKTYILQFPLKNMVKAERLLGKSLQKVFTAKKDPDLGVAIPDYSLEDLIVLFKIGLKPNHPEITDDQAEELLTAFLSEGKSLLIQSSMLFTILGKALGFFRTEIDIQQKMTEVLTPKETR